MSEQALAQEWFVSARSDYRYAQLGLKQRWVFPQVAFLAQQVAEKYLKGFLALNGLEPPRIHDLPKLLGECVRIAPELKELQDACELLTGLYVEARYPPDIPDYTKEDLASAFEQAKQVRDLIEGILKRKRDSASDGLAGLQDR